MQQKVGGEFASEVGQVKDRSEPGILLPNEIRVVSQAEDGLCAQRGLVRLLYAIAEPLVVVSLEEYGCKGSGRMVVPSKEADSDRPCEVVSYIAPRCSQTP